MTPGASVAGRLLVAAAALADPNFRRTVVFMIQHDGDGALGVVLNRPSEVPVREVVPTWAPYIAEPGIVFVGGPVSPEAAICLGRRPAGAADGWQPVVGEIGALDLAIDPTDAPPGVSDLRLFGGYSGWSAGQLDAELDAGGWYVVPSIASDVFCADPETLWHDVLVRQRGPLRQWAFFPEDLIDN